MTVEVNNESGTEVDEHMLAELGRFVLDALRIDPLAEASVLLVDVDTMAALHQQWMDLPGPTDVMARLIGQKLSEKLGQQFYIENIGGAGGNLGVSELGRSAPGSR